MQKLDKERIPNIVNLIDAQASPPFDPEREYSLPWQSGMTGIAWNEELTGPVESIEQLFEDPKLKGKVSMLMELADSVGLVMLANGDDPAEVTDESFQEAVDRVQAAVDSGQIVRFTGNDFAQPLTKGELAACGCLVRRHDPAPGRQPEAQVGRPEGRRDDLDGQHVHPHRGQRRDRLDVHELRVRPEGRREDRRRTSTTSRRCKGAKEELLKIDPEIANNTLIIPDDALLEQLHQYDSSALGDDEHISKWQTVLGQ